MYEQGCCFDALKWSCMEDGEGGVDEGWIRLDLHKLYTGCVSTDGVSKGLEIAQSF